jgi:hypothetical protein
LIWSMFSAWCAFFRVRLWIEPEIAQYPKSTRMTSVSLPRRARPDTVLTAPRVQACHVRNSAFSGYDLSSAPLRMSARLLLIWSIFRAWLSTFGVRFVEFGWIEPGIVQNPDFCSRPRRVRPDTVFKAPRV